MKAKTCATQQILRRSDQGAFFDETLAYIMDPKRGFITLYNKPLFSFNIRGLGRTEQRHMNVNCVLSWITASKNDSITMQTENTLQDIKKTEEKLKEVTT